MFVLFSYINRMAKALILLSYSYCSSSGLSNSMVYIILHTEGNYEINGPYSWTSDSGIYNFFYVALCFSYGISKTVSTHLKTFLYSLDRYMKPLKNSFTRNVYRMLCYNKVYTKGRLWSPMCTISMQTCKHIYFISYIRNIYTYLWCREVGLAFITTSCNAFATCMPF
jgi:hypothetical protein